MKKHCLICNKEFNVDSWALKNRACKYCSKECSAIGRKTGEYRECLVCCKEFYIIPAQIKRRSTNGQYCSKECMYKSPIRNAKISSENHYLWKGEDTGYHAKHEWISRLLGKADICTICGSDKRVEWSNKDHKYTRNVDDWQKLCHKCHHHYDLDNGLRINTLSFNHQS